MKTRLRKIRQDILKIAHHTGHGHIPTCFSVIELIDATYQTMNHDPSDLKSSKRDIFILSKGHASLSHYCILASLGYFPEEDLYQFGAFNSNYGCHSDRLKIPGVEASTGSLGHGIGLAVGIALAFKIKKQPNNVFVLIGDGESNEGTIWESLLVADNLKLNNLTILYDNNNSHARGLQIKNPQEKFRAFGCQTFQVEGHNVEKIMETLKIPTDSPKAVVGDTIKGYGCKTLIENTYPWHRRSPNETELSLLLEELNAKTV